MRDYILRRLLLLPLIMLGVSFLTFAAFRIIPGGPENYICEFGCPEEVLQDIRHELKTDRPWYEQYGDWLWNVARGDLGHSFLTTLPVTTELNRRLPITGELLIMTLLLSLLLGIPPGVLSAIRPGTPVDWIARVSSVLWLSIPPFWLGILIITFGVSWFGWAPPQFGRGYVPFFDDPWVNLQQFFFPSLVLSLGVAAGIMRLTRSSLMEVMRNDYIRTARSKGLSERAVVARHALRNALIPVTTIVGLQIGALIGGAVIIELLFALNGAGIYLLNAILTRDILVVQSVVLILALTYVLANLTVDVLYGWLDPRIRYT